jgi:hypothetical protein
MLWHRRLGHRNVRQIIQLFTQDMTADGHALQNRIQPGEQQYDRHCDSCAVCKHHAANRPPSIPEESRAKQPLQTVHIDLRGPHTSGVNHELYQFLIVDEYTRYTASSVLKHKDEAFAYFERFATAANNFHRAKGYSIQFIRSDNGKELIGGEWNPLLTQLGIQRQRTSPYTPHQNGIVERHNRTIGECTRAMLHAAGLPERFWPFACQAAVYLHNRLPNKANGNATPYELWHSKRPSIGHIRVFGCLAYALIHKPGKLEDRATRCTFIGYPVDSSKTYLLWNNQEQKLVRSGHVHFVENIMGFNYNPKATVGKATAGEAAAGEEKITQALINRARTDAASTPTVSEQVIDITPTNINYESKYDEPQDQPHPNDQEHEPEQPHLNRRQQGQLRRLRDTLSPAAHDAAPAAQITNTMLNSRRPQLRAGPGRQHYYGNIHATLSEQPTDNSLALEEPRTFQQAVESSHSTEWVAAIRSELNSHVKAGTWRYALKPVAANLVGCRWIFKVKRDKDGNISKFKARLVAQGFTQVHGIDYEETYAPVARYSSIRLILAMAAHYDWEVHQMDVKTAYLNGELDVPIYMRQPEGLELIDQTCPTNHVCLLIKSLYGLKQSGRQWHTKINHTLISSGFKPLHADRCVYVKRKSDSIVIILLYVDDLLVTSSKPSEMISVKRKLQQQYEMEDMGEVTFILGIDIKRDRAIRSISIGQSAYLNMLLQRHGMADCNSTSTPMDPAAAHDMMAGPDGYQATPTLTRDYQSIIGGLMFAAICTRPDIAFAVNRLARYCANPTDAHYSAAKRVLRYLKGTVSYSIHYTGTADTHPQLVGYCDADWAQDKDNKRKSTSGYIFIMCGGAISWQSKKQSSVALSSTQAELMAITSSTKELLWFRHHLGGIGLNRAQPTILFIDSQCAIDIANNSKISDRSKHIEVQHFFIREHIEAGTVKLQHIASNEQTADTMTKPLHRVTFKRCAEMLGLVPREDKVKKQKLQKQLERRGEVLEQSGARPALLAAVDC